MGKPHWLSKQYSPASQQPIKAHERNSNTSACQLIEALFCPLRGNRMLVVREHLCPATQSPLIIIPHSPPRQHRSLSERVCVPCHQSLVL